MIILEKAADIYIVVSDKFAVVYEYTCVCRIIV